MKLQNRTAQIYVPDSRSVAIALRRVTQLGIGAHPDDLEFMAFQGICECHASDGKWFGGITCTNGSGSPRAGAYKDFTNAQMRLARRREQNVAAVAGHYSVMIQLDYPGCAARIPSNAALKEDLKNILAATQPEVVFTHNLADKHDVHVGVAITALQAMRELPRNRRPKRVVGCEVWRNLDWLPDAEKVVMDVSGHDHLAAALNGVFDSQIAGGKRYDLATLGRRAANATFFQPHATDKATQLMFGMELTPLVMDETKDIEEYVGGFIERFKGDVRARLIRQSQKT
jgi:LmbE family N-acetylglucosaminyl deacetylase